MAAKHDSSVWDDDVWEGESVPESARARGTSCALRLRGDGGNVRNAINEAMKGENSAQERQLRGR